jgi:hypothetical protein
MQGFGVGPFEMLVPLSIGDMHSILTNPANIITRYFVHERGKRIAIQALSFFGVSFFTPIISSQINDNMYYIP